jgi:CheY-like chemotaxis protein
MPEEFRILFVDDEETFLCSTADLLRREGFECDSALDVDAARRLIVSRTYDLVIADIKMPGNADLEFVRQLRQMSDTLPVILVTGHPSVRSAIQSVELPVVAYLVKPFDFAELLAKVRVVAARSAIGRAVSNRVARLNEYRDGLADIEKSLADHPRGAHASSLQALIGITLHSIVEGLSDLHRLMEDTQDGKAHGELRQWKPAVSGEVRDALRDTVATLERTRSSFKSKELGELRRRLEGLLKT